jgi:hypothetical protein
MDGLLQGRRCIKQSVDGDVLSVTACLCRTHMCCLLCMCLHTWSGCSLKSGQLSCCVTISAT